METDHLPLLIYLQLLPLSLTTATINMRLTNYCGQCDLQQVKEPTWWQTLSILERNRKGLRSGYPAQWIMCSQHVFLYSWCHEMTWSKLLKERKILIRVWGYSHHGREVTTVGMWGSCSRPLWSQEADSKGYCCPALCIQPRTSTHGMVPPTVTVGFPTSVSYSRQFPTGTRRDIFPKWV